MFRKICLLSTWFILLATCGWCQVLLVPTSKDFGVVRPGNHYTARAKITNSSTKAVTLSDPSLNCGCASASLSKKILTPGSWALLTMDYLPDETQSGPQVLTATLAVSSSAKKGQVTGVERSFQIKAQVKPYQTLEPPTLMAAFMNGQKPTGVEGRLELDEKACAGWKLVKAEADSNSFAAHVEALPTPLTFSVRLGVPEGLSPGTYAGKVLILGSGKLAGRVEYPYQVVINSLFDVEPRELQLSPLNPQKIKTWKALTQVKRIDGKPFKILKIEDLPAWLKYDVQKAPNEGGYMVHWSMDLGKLPGSEKERKSLPTFLTMDTDASMERSVHIELETAKIEPIIMFKKPLPITENETKKPTPAPKGTPVLRPKLTPLQTAVSLPSGTSK